MNIYRRYLNDYGGIKALVTSFYFWTAFFLSLLLYKHWTSMDWWDDVLSIIPSMLGFSLGGYAMWMAIGDDKFRKLISGKSEDGSPSPYMKLSASFVHFILFQFLSIFIALFAKTYNFYIPPEHIIKIIFGGYFKYLCLIGYFIGYFIFIYALLTGLAATMSLFYISSWYDMYHTKQKSEKKNRQE